MVPYGALISYGSLWCPSRNVKGVRRPNGACKPLRLRFAGYVSESWQIDVACHVVPGRPRSYHRAPTSPSTVKVLGAGQALPHNLSRNTRGHVPPDTRLRLLVNINDLLGVLLS
jgi:hypothetical protein